MDNNIRIIDEAVKTLNIVRHNTERGEIRNGKVDINLSTGFTWLIQSAGQCRFYSSDLLYDIESINDAIQSCADSILVGDSSFERIFYLGFREMGVDGNSFIAHKIEHGNCYTSFEGVDAIRHIYHALYCVTVNVVDYYGPMVQVTFEEVGIK